MIPSAQITFMEISYGALSGNHPEEEVEKMMIIHVKKIYNQILL
jgi:hypothetical protein